jgi:signal transduction histidine kinase
MLADVLRQFGSGCVVVGQDLSILHANRAARGFFVKGARRSGEFEFADLPAGLGSKVYQVLKSGTGLAPFRYQPAESPGSVYQVSVVPVQNRASPVPHAVLLIVEDRSQDDQLKRLEIETANLRLVKQMADRLAHEIGNAMVPLSTHQQLFAKKYQDPEFRVSLDTAMADGVRRVTRLINQMRLLARDGVVHHEVFPLAPLVEEAYQEAQRFHPVKTAHLKYNIGDQPILLSGDRASLKHAVAEIMLNALQSNAENVRIAVDMKEESGSGPTPSWVHIDFKDNGSGFSPEAAARAPEAFFTTRNVGLGLGLVVSRKVVEQHQGRLEIVQARSDRGGQVRLSLPIAAVGGADPDLGLKT